ADNWLHLILGIGMLGLGFGLSRRTTDNHTGNVVGR
ncbi:membrane protein, partial [Arthrobacter sp. AK-YN10]